MGGHDHETPNRLNHPPTEEQKVAALKWVDDVRAAVREDGVTLATLQNPANHWVQIGDTIHFVKPEYSQDENYLDGHHPEAFAVMNRNNVRKIVAVMFVYNPKRLQTTLDDVPDIAGNWTKWHGHNLSYQSNDPTQDGYYKLGFGYPRTDPPMIHVWLEPNACGPWASAGAGEGSCIRELANY